MNPAAFMNQFGPIIVIFAIFYFLIIRPQQKREKDRRNMLSSLKEGDDILTIGGIYGRILNLKKILSPLMLVTRLRLK